MIIDQQIKQLLGPLWEMKKESSNHVRFENKRLKKVLNFIDVKKEESRREGFDRVHVTVPLEHVNFKSVFSNEMPAYEYIEDLVYDCMEKGVEFGEQMIERTETVKKIGKSNDVKRRRLSSSSCFYRIEPYWG